jgi:hypothetical protein
MVFTREMKSVISNLWDTDPVYVSNLKLKQILVLAGDGNIFKEETSQDLRQFFSKIDLGTMSGYIEDALSSNKEDKFDERGYVLQDMVNEMGSRLGYRVANGLYRGKRNNENGYDGLWRCPDGACIIMESKTSDAYTLDLEAIVGYREELIEARAMERKNSSILIVLGRADRGTFPSLIRGSNYSQNIRIISTRALFELLKIYERNPVPVVQRQIMELLKPHDFMQLDNLVELVFPQAEGGVADSAGAVNLAEVVNPVGVAERDIPSLVGDCNQDVVIPELPDRSLKVGRFIHTAMERLSGSGYVFSEAQLEKLCDRAWSKKTFKIGYPFMKRKSAEGETRLRDAGGYGRYWVDCFRFGDAEVFITKEWFEENGSRERFIEWYEGIEDGWGLD